MRNTKLIVAMVAGCMALSGAAFAQDSTMKKDPTPAATPATPTQTTSDSMKSGDSMKADDSSMKSGDSMKGGAMKSTHKKHKKAAAGAETAPAKTSSSGM